MSRRIRHTHAGRNEWVVVHREGRRGNGGGLGGLLMLGGIIAAVWVIWEVVKWLVELFVAIFPYLLGAGAIVAAIYVWAMLKAKA